MLQYAQDWDDTLPAANRWADLSSKYTAPGIDAKLYHCPEATSRFSYAFNSGLGEQRLPDAEVSAHTVLLFEANVPIKNAFGGRELLVHPPRHDTKDVFSFADGHVKLHKPSEVDLH